MKKKIFVLSEEALEVLNSPKGKNRLMEFFGIKDRRTVETHLANNVPSGIFVSKNIGYVIRDIAPDMPEKRIFRILNNEEIKRMTNESFTPFTKKRKDEKNCK